MKVVQIGANKGNDDVFNFLQGKQIDFLLLVEPMSFHVKDLAKCYEHTPNVHIEQVVVSAKETNEKVKIYYNQNDGPGYESASIEKGREGGDESKISFEEVSSFTLPQLLDKYGITELDYLFIDAEGEDDNIILSTDLKKYDIKHIEYEHLHLRNREGLAKYFEDNHYKHIPHIPSKNDYNSHYVKE